MKRASGAVEAYAAALNSSTSNEEVLALLRAPLTGHAPTGMPEMLPFLQSSSAADKSTSSAAGGKKRKADSPNEGDETNDAVPGKRQKKEKKLKDPNAPKRPASAYLIYQNEIRQNTKASHPNLNYRDLITQVGEQWKALGESGQQVRFAFEYGATSDVSSLFCSDKTQRYKDEAEQAMQEWKTKNAEYTATHGVYEGPEHDDADAQEVDAQLTKPVKKEKKEKKDKEAKKSKPSSTAAPPVSQSEQVKKEVKPAAPGTPIGKPAAAPKAAPAVPASTQKKNMPPALAQSSSDSDDSDDDSDASDSE